MSPKYPINPYKYDSNQMNMAKRQRNALSAGKNIDKLAYIFPLLFSLKKVIIEDNFSILFSSSQLVE